MSTSAPHDRIVVTVVVVENRGDRAATARYHHMIAPGETVESLVGRLWKPERYGPSAERIELTLAEPAPEETS